VAEAERPPIQLVNADGRELIVGALGAAAGIVREAGIPEGLHQIAFAKVYDELMAPRKIQLLDRDDGKKERDPELWRCPICDGAPQALAQPGGETIYGCQRGHALAAAPAGAKLR
jgi:hypothetical protein